MPYISRTRRSELPELPDYRDLTAGDLNYLITTLAIDYIADHGCNYATMNEVIGVLECAKQELYRRWLAPYEDSKIAEHGDIYPKGQTQ